MNKEKQMHEIAADSVRAWNGGIGAQRFGTMSNGYDDKAQRDAIRAMLEPTHEVFSLDFRRVVLKYFNIQEGVDYKWIHDPMGMYNIDLATRIKNRRF